MNRVASPSRLPTLLVSLALSGLASGCASLGLPRIDPSGDRIFLWPKDQPQAPTLALPSNPTAAPVYTDPVFPAVPAGSAPGLAAGGAPTAVTANLNTPRDMVTITPERILAPVGSEVVLKSSICTAEGYTLADQKVEWMLGRNGVGQFVEVSGKGFLHPPWLPWNKPKKADNYLAYGYTANGPLCINRGTADGSDDVNINRGDAWISVHSPVEGTSYVTAYAPDVEGWGERRKTAVIYWVDVQWLFPPATVTSSGRPETLTTTVTRQTDGTPIEGWTVRYEVDDAGSTAGAAQVAEVRTGPDGRASVEVSPTAAGASSSRIRTQLIRPARFNGGEEPRLVIASGETVINWTGSTPYIPQTTPAQPTAPLPTNPPLTPVNPGIGGTPSVPSIPPAPAAKPRLEVEVRPVGKTDIRVGDVVQYEVTVRNVGDAVATGVRVDDKFSAGLSHVGDREGDHQVGIDLGSLGPGMSRVLPLEFNVTQAGPQVHDVTVSSVEGAQKSARVPLTVGEAAPQAQPGLKVEKVGPVQKTVGETALFTITVRNTGDTTLTNVVVIDEYPTGFLRAQPHRAGGEIVGGNIRWVVPQMRPGETQTFDVDALCLQQSLRVTTTVKATAESGPGAGVIPTAATASLEILPARGGVGPQPGPGPAAATGPLSIDVRSSTEVLRPTLRAVITVEVVNTSTANDQEVMVRLEVPAGLTIDPNEIRAPRGAQAQAQSASVLVFTPINEIRPGEKLPYQITVTAAQPGVFDVLAQTRSRNQTTAANDTVRIEVTAR